MKIQKVTVNQPNQKYNFKTNTYKAPSLTNDRVGFTGLMPSKIKNALKLCVFDLDETLLEGPQEIRNKVLEFAKEKNKFLVYSSARPINKVQSLIDDKTLINPDFCVCNNGENIYKNNNGNLEELTFWSEKLAETFNKSKVRDAVLKIAKENMFSKEEWAKFDSIPVPQEQKEFTGSKITEYIGFESPLNIRFYMAPGIFEKTVGAIKKQLAKSKVETNIVLQKYGAEELVPGFLEKYFSPKIAEDIRSHAIPRSDKDGLHDAMIISTKTDKGHATEYIRKLLGLKKNEVFASGDAENDYSHINKGYFFAFLSNATEGLKKMVSDLPKERIINATQPGVRGIYEVIEP